MRSKKTQKRLSARISKRIKKKGGAAAPSGSSVVTYGIEENNLPHHRAASGSSVVTDGIGGNNSANSFVMVPPHMPNERNNFANNYVMVPNFPSSDVIQRKVQEAHRAAQEANRAAQEARRLADIAERKAEGDRIRAIARIGNQHTVGPMERQSRVFNQRYNNLLKKAEELSKTKKTRFIKPKKKEKPVSKKRKRSMSGKRKKSKRKKIGRIPLNSTSIFPTRPLDRGPSEEPGFFTKGL